MTATDDMTHVVVDGSNIATEGRSMPSLAQLNEAVMAFIEEHPKAAITVVVDATFGHRIDKSEVKEFDAGIANNELVAPPAGAVGRGDAFVLGIADKADAVVLSNDSFQEFHGKYSWLFDEGRLIGGKPVPHVGWVFVDRVPVRGPVSRKATARKRTAKRAARSSKRASEPMPVPSSPPPGRAATKNEPRSEEAAAREARRPAPRRGEMVNELLPFLEFVEHHPVGTSINGTVDSYSSHGAYITIGNDGVRGYVPLRLMADPAPTSARKVMKIGESITAVVVNFAPGRRSIDCALPDMSADAIANAAASGDDEAQEALTKSPRPTGARGPERSPSRDERSTDASEEPEVPAPPPEPIDGPKDDQPVVTADAPARKRRSRKKAAATVAEAEQTPDDHTPSKEPAKKTTAKKKASAKKSAARKSAAKKTTAKKTSARKSTAKKTTAKKTSARKSTAKKTTAKKAAAQRSTAKKKASAKKTAAKRSGGKKSTGRMSSASTKVTADRAATDQAASPAQDAGPHADPGGVA